MLVKYLRIFFVLGLFVLFVWVFMDNQHAVFARLLGNTGGIENQKIYLPLTLNNFPRPATQFGGEFTSSDSAAAALAEQAGLYWARIHALDWDLIEPNPPVNGVHTYDWSKVPEDFLIQLSANRMQVIALVKKSPAWAQQQPGVVCGPIKQDALDDFAAFMSAAVQRYSKSPYNIRYWELGNEPDVDPSLVTSDSVFGCWGDIDDPYYGGGYYGEMLKLVTPAIKSADPMAKVLIGGLLLACDPENPPEGDDCRASLFLDGILRVNAASAFDIISFHGYPFLRSTGQVLDEQFPGWEVRGGVVVGKIVFLRDIMARYGVDKPLIHSEGSLTCPEWNHTYCDVPDSFFYQTQSAYVPKLYLRNWSYNLLGTIWYPFNGDGWHYSGMVGSDTASPKPSYHAFEFMTSKLYNATYMDEITTYSGVVIYRFRLKNGNILWAVWSKDGLTQTIAVPDGLVSGYDLYGTPFNAAGGLDVTAPVYLEVRP